MMGNGELQRARVGTIASGVGRHVLPTGLADCAFRSSARYRLSGDLLEEYREARDSGQSRAKMAAWYIAQVFGFGWRNAWVWAALMGGALVVRTGMDWLVPVPSRPRNTQTIQSSEKRANPSLQRFSST